MAVRIFHLLIFNFKNTFMASTIKEKPKLVDYKYNTSGPYNITYIIPASHKAHESMVTT